MQLLLSTLGALQATTTDAAGTERVLGRGKPVAMLAYLACVPGHRASREHLAALLWGDVESEAARQNVRQTIWYLKKKLGDGLLDVTGEMLSLVAPCTCDRDEFMGAARRADFAAAVKLYTGPFIPDFAAPGASEFEQWCELERRRVMVTFLRCADALARQWLGEGKFRDAQELARRARDVDPMDQATWRLLLESLIAGSDSLGAASEAEHFETFLAREEQEPDAASRAALRAARRATVAPLPGDSRLSASIASELVGRESQFSHVLAAWEHARAGSPRVLVVTAAAGLGKSRLLRDVQARLRASRARCVLVRANPGDRHLSAGFAAEITSQVAALPGAAAISTGSAGVLVSLAPALAATYPNAAPDGSDGEEAVRRRALAAVDLMRAVSEEQPVAILLDDLHWADEHSARVIAAALSRLEHARVLVVMTRRVMADPRAHYSGFEQLELPPLDLAAVSSFVSHVGQLPATPWADILPQQLLLATGGSPLLLVETLHDALEQGWLKCSAAGNWECEDPLRITLFLREGSAVRQRVQRLSPTARHGLLALAILGRPVRVEDARKMMGDRAVALEEPLEVLERGGFVARHGASLVVAHDEIADAVVEASSVEERQRIHGGIARELAAHRDDETALRRAAEHARACNLEPVLTQAWRAFLSLRRRAGDRRGTRSLAADFLTLERDAPAVQRLVSSTPVLKRRRLRWIAAAGGLATLSLGAAAAWPRAPRVLTADFAVWTVDSTTGVRRLVGVQIVPDAPWESGAPIEAMELDSLDYPSVPAGGTGAVTRMPGGRTWWINAHYADVGQEGVLIDSLGGVHQPLRHTGDDAITDVSPDGRQFLSVTARFDTVTDHQQVVTTGVLGGVVRRISVSSEIDGAPAWRPDGTQVAFLRRYFETLRADRACLVDVDGTHERCLDVAVPSEYSLSGWADERRLLLRTPNDSLWLLDVQSGKSEPIRNLTGVVWPLSGQFGSCRCRTTDEGEASLYVFPTANPAAARPVLFRGRPLRGTLAVVATTFAAGEWLDVLRLRLPAGGLSVDLVHRLSVEGVRANGAPAWLHDLRWTARDTTVATVDSTGRLRPKRVGTTWIVVSAGGWRTDSALAHITLPSSRSTLRESWSSDWTTRWQPFGTPPAKVVQTSRGPALLPNGDGSYPSGAFLREAFAVSKGAGVEFTASLPVTRSQWQTLNVFLLPGDVLPAMRAWDQRTGPGPAFIDVCGFSAPGSNSTSAHGAVQITSRQRVKRVPVPRALFDGTWHVLRLQLLEDGRCALAIDGVAVGDAGPVGGLPATAFVSIVGDDRFGGRLVVRHVEAWSGVRGGVDWTTLDVLPAKRD
jgi:DNA-binding SARP family transcriptional activator